jgi:serine/threonine protein kinase/tetratricopeptide (TPR) repeat protein
MVESKPGLRTIFCDALERDSPQEVAAYLDAACGGDAELRAQVEALLKSYHEAGNFLDPPTSQLTETADFSTLTECPGAVIGPYKLLEQIGEGGFGVVFMAEQTEPVRRRVALKIIKPGMDTRQVIARFEAERQALALMDHPNIAKVLDAGTTGEVRNGEWGVRNEGISHSALPTPHSAGRPYFVMELVQGVPITDYCDQCQLTTRERLELFITVCQAVQHAHQKGVIHRDLKPTNILVAMQDGQPAPKIIDFGVAKALNQRLTEATLATGYAQMIGTPLYMSPEQAELSPLGADTRSDIYSLGVLLYELLTGTTPFEKERLHSASFDELRRILREEDPPRPSARLSSLSLRKRTGTQESSQPLFSKEGRGEGQERPGASETAALATTIANHRRTDPRRLLQTLRGELDWIVMKCLEKDRNRRYETAGALALDVQRFLNDEPVEACPPSAAYRLKKFARRNRTLLTTVSLVAASLIVGTCLSVSQAIRATRSEALATARLRDATKARADAEASARLARQAVDDMYTQVAEKWLAHQPRMEPIQHEFLQKALQFYTQFAGDPGTAPEIRLETARAYCRIAEIQHRLGQATLAENAFLRAVEQLQALVNEFPSAAVYRAELAATLHKLGILLGDTGRSGEEEQVHRRALSMERQLLAEFPNSPTYLRDVGRGHWFVGQTLLAIHQRAAAEQEFQAAINVQRELVQKFPNDPQYRFHLAQTHLRRGLALRFLDQLEEGHQSLVLAAEMLERLVAELPTVPDYRNELANTYYWQVYYCRQKKVSRDEINYLSRAIALQEQLAAEYPSVTDYQYDLFRSHKTLGRTLLKAGRTADAERALRNAETIAQKLVADAPTVHYYRAGLAYVHMSLGELFAHADRPADAETAYLQAIALLSDLVEKSPDVPQYQRRLADSYEKLATVLHSAGRNTEAAAARNDARRAARKLAPSHRITTESLELDVDELTDATEGTSLNDHPLPTTNH